MSKELQSGVEHFDGKEVTSYSGRFSGSFDVELDKGTTIAGDDLCAFFITARAGDAKFSISKTTGLLSRHNTFVVEDAVVMDLDKAKWLYDQLGKVVVGVTELIETKQLQSDEPTLFKVPPVESHGMFLAVNVTNGSVAS